MSAPLCKLLCKQLGFPIFHRKKVFLQQLFALCQSAQQALATDLDIPERSLGQPSCYTHPNLIRSGEVTPNITKEEFHLRRTKLMKSIQKATQGSHMVIVPSAETIEMSPDVPYFFRQDTDFLYLCGFQESGSALVLESTRQELNGSHVSSLFVEERNPQKELWAGSRAGTKDVIKLTGVDKGQNVRETLMSVNRFLEQNPDAMLWYKPAMIGHRFHGELQNSISKECVSFKHFIHDLRVIKSPREIELMQTSCEIAAEALKEVMKFSHSGVNEHHLFAKMDYECRVNGAEFLAYPPVVAGGNRACTIHYISNNQVVKEGELVLMDAGCEYHGYASDITRTFPVSGKFSKSQRELYQAVLRIQVSCINLCTVGNTLESLFKSMVEFLVEEIKLLNLIPPQTDKSDTMLNFLARQLCPHHVSHYLGMDVHDTESVSRNRPLEPGMVITVEPGIYIREDDNRFPEEYRGIGIRIEDDILITETGPVVLSKNCPKEVEEIEELASHQSGKSQLND